MKKINKFSELTQFISQIKDDSFGEWIVDRENDGSPEHPIHFPYVNYSTTARNLITAIYDYGNAHPEFEHTKYGAILKDYGIESPEKADVSSMDAKGVFALLVGAVREERFCDGALLEYYENGCILRWLERLAEIDYLSNL